MSLDLHFTTVYKVVDGSLVSVKIYLPGRDVANRSGSSKHPVVIDIHGGAFMLGHFDMVSRDQIQYCLAKGWIVAVPNHRLCPQVNLLEGPMADCRDLLEWIYDGSLDRAIEKEFEPSSYQCDLDRVVAFGTSSGGHLALSLGWQVKKPVAAIFDLYGPCDFDDAFWSKPLPHMAEKTGLPLNLPDDFLNRIYREYPVPTRGGVSLEGQATAGPASKGHDFSDPRTAFALTQVVKGSVLKAIYPAGLKEQRGFSIVDPIYNIHRHFPPTIIIHGAEDTQVPIHLSRRLYEELQKARIESKFVEIPNEEHTFAAKMKVGSKTWDLQQQGFDFLEKVITSN